MERMISAGFSRTVQALLLLVTALWLSAAPGPTAAQAGMLAQSSAAAEAAPEGSGTSLGTLIEVLKDDVARTALIEDLERAVSASAAPPEPPESSEIVSLGRRIALITQNAGQEAVAGFNSLRDSLSSGDSAFSGLNGEELSVLITALPGLLTVIVSTVSVFLILRRLARGFYARVGRKAQASGFARSAGLFIGSNLMDALIVVLAWALGYVVALFAVGDMGMIGLRQTLYLNAFLGVEMVKVVIRSVLSPISSGLRIVPVSDAAARALTRYFSVVVSVLGYGQLLIVPIVNQSASAAAGNGVSALLSVFVLGYLVYIVLRRRVQVAHWLEAATDPRRALESSLEDPAAQSPEDQVEQPAAGDLNGPQDEASPQETLEFAPRETEESRGWIGGMLAGIAHIWHWFALAYLAGMFVVVMTQPVSRMLSALSGSAKILVAVILAALVSGWLARAVGRGISLPGDVNAKLPLLEVRINRFVPRAFGVLRLGLLVCVLMFTLDIIGFLDMRAWLESRVGLQVTTTIVSLTVILLVSFGLWLALTSFVDYKLNPEYGGVPTARETTLLTLLRNAATIALLVFTLMFALSEIGLNIGPLLASAGVLGLAIGFGSQKLVQDIITGVFIQFENAINVGDVITVGGTTGVVERLSVRSVSLRDAHGVFHIIPFSTVDMVSNFMKDFSYFVCDMGIAYRESVDDAKDAMHHAFDLLREDKEVAPNIIGDLEWFGLNSFGDSAVVVRARIKTVPGKQWAAGRAYNGLLKKVFDERGIEIPFPQQTIWFGEAKDGSTQPIRIAGEAREA